MKWHRVEKKLPSHYNDVLVMRQKEGEDAESFLFVDYYKWYSRKWAGLGVRDDNQFGPVVAWAEIEWPTEEEWNA